MSVETLDVNSASLPSGLLEAPPDLYPLIFYSGHTATFFINKFLLVRLISQRIDERFESIFTVGVDEMSWNDLDSNHHDWPTPHEVKSYRNKDRLLVIDLIEGAALQLPVDWENAWWAIIIGIEHEGIQLKTSSVLIRQHKMEFVRSVDSWQSWREAGLANVNIHLDYRASSCQVDKFKRGEFFYDIIGNAWQWT